MAIVFGMLFLSMLLTSYGQTTTFAQFFEQTGSQDFVFTNNTSSSTFAAVGGGSPIFFIYSNISGLDPSLGGIQSAHLFVTTTTNSPAVIAGGNITQPLDQTTTIQIIRDTAAPVGVGAGSRRNLLTAVFSTNVGTPGIVGAVGGNSATLSVTTPGHLVTFTSDFLLFGATTERNLAFSFSSVAPTLGVGAGGFLQSLTAAGSGTFASNPPPTKLVVTAAPASLSGRVTTPNGLGLYNAQVVLSETNGTVHYAQTSAFGYFHFDGIQSGQSVIISINSKKYRFSPQVVSLRDDIADLNFVGSY